MISAPPNSNWNSLVTTVLRTIMARLQNLDVSSIWKRIGEAWKSILENVEITSPQDRYKVLDTHLRWNSEIQEIGQGLFKEQRGATLTGMALATFGTCGSLKPTNF